MVDQRDEEQRAPEKDVRAGDDQEHLDALHAVALHAIEVLAHFPMLFQRAGGLCGTNENRMKHKPSTHTFVIS